MTATEIEFDMTTIRRQHRETRKWPWVLLAIVMLGIAAVLVFVKPQYGTQNQIRGNPSDNQKVPEETQKENTGGDDTNEKEDPTGGRDITFEVTYLDGEEGATDKFVIRTNPDWAPLGVEQFHVSSEQWFGS